MLYLLYHAVITQAASTPAPADLNEVITTTVATMTAIGAASIGIMKLIKRLLRRWLATDDLGAVVRKQTEVLESQGRVLAKQVELSEIHTQMHADLKADMQRSLDVSARMASHQDATSSHLAEVAHQLERQHDRLDGIERHMDMAAMMRNIKVNGS